MKLKKLELELADDFRLLETKKGREQPYLKRWRVWCNGVCLGDIVKRSDGNFRIYNYKCDIGDIYSYDRTTLPNGKVSYKYNRDKKDPRKFDGFKDIKEAKKAFVANFKSNLKHIIEGYD